VVEKSEQQQVQVSKPVSKRILIFVEFDHYMSINGTLLKKEYL